MTENIVELIAQMREKGVEQMLPPTERKILLRSLDVETLLLQGKVPDILTPLVIKSVYQDMDDDSLIDFLKAKEVSVGEAIKHLEAIDYVVELCIADDTRVKDLTIGERRWIFRLVMMPAEILVTFRFQPFADVESLPEGDQVRETAERDIPPAEFVSFLDAR